MDNLILFLWFIELFKPEWILSFYIPGIGIIKGIPTILLYLLFIYLILYEKRKLTFDKSFLLFIFSIFISTVFAENTGLGRRLFYSQVDYLIYYTLNISLLGDKKKNVDKIFTLYLLAFVFYGIIGIVYKGVVPFHVYLSDEDAFGPFMAMGIPLSFYAAFKYRKTKYTYFIISILSLNGVIVSFARGAFISICATVVFIWYRFQKKIIFTLVMGLAVIIFIVSVNTFFKHGEYWKEMSTILGSTNAETPDGRVFLWTKAWKMFVNSPLTGVGPYNYGFILPRITSDEELYERGIRPSLLYGRVPHNIYFQLLSEVGAIGVFSFIVLLYVFWRKNREIQRTYYKDIFINNKQLNPYPDDVSEQFRKDLYYAIAVEGAMVAYLVNGLFYDILFYPWIFDILILNSLIYKRLRLKHQESLLSYNSLENVKIHG